MVWLCTCGTLTTCKFSGTVSECLYPRNTGSREFKISMKDIVQAELYVLQPPDSGRRTWKRKCHNVESRMTVV